ncbi:tannase and feruloyl esterase [Tothia fuscella]|uniref:Carboxylic ester hydrolase n=1 Tax=Tothia fuscella TaxID=1048955 RepID=A0A9P4NET7_9PEZI|nr:tannase and feruloyl esterase [Tothia fuscella]
MALLQRAANVVACSPTAIPYPSLPGAQVRSLEAHTVHKGYQYVIGGLYSNNGLATSPESEFCNVTIQYTPQGTEGRTTVQIWLPTEDWNGRLQAAGGSGWTAGLSDTAFGTMTGAVIEGYAAASTDGGHPNAHPKYWALKSDGKVDMENFRHYAQTSLNDLSILGKAVAKSFYGKAPHHSYWNGCSQGGRQGYMLAQKYPSAFNGIAASAPVLDWSQLTPAGFWAQTQMHEIGTYINPCELAALSAAATKACDGKDGLIDGIISDSDACYFDAFSLVNTTVDCGFGQLPRNVTREAATVAHVGWTGRNSSIHPDLLPYLDTTLGLADSVCQTNGTCVGKPFSLVGDWIKYFIQKDPNYDFETIKWPEFDRQFQVSVDEYHEVIGTNDTNLKPFRDAGGKLITYHGLADSIIPSRNTRFYWNAVAERDQNLHDYYRLFEAPGVGHCYTGTGLYPQGIFKSLVDWVENGKAPDVLDVDMSSTFGPKKTRILCPHPQKARYKGGSPDVKSSYTCA